MSNIKEFFEKHILFLYQNVKTGEIIYLNDKFNTDEDSYFSKPIHPECQYLSTIPLQNEVELNSYLETFWNDEPALLNLIPDLVKLAFTLKEENKEQAAELSPFLYVMY
jgi:hypothetical protein